MVVHVSLDDVKQAHYEVLKQHGGLDGVRDEVALDAAINRPVNLEYYCPQADIFDMAAVLISGIIKNHPFLDGNKRTGLAVGLSFLKLNCISVVVNKQEGYDTILALIESKISEEELASFLRSCSV